MITNRNAVEAIPFPHIARDLGHNPVGVGFMGAPFPR